MSNATKITRKHSNRARRMLDSELMLIYEALGRMTVGAGSHYRQQARTLRDLLDQAELIVIPWPGTPDPVDDSDGELHADVARLIAEGEAE